MATATVSVTDAAFMLSLTYNATLRLVLTHRLKGKRVRGRWAVEKADVERLQKEFAQESDP
ncbi:MAG: hypothetical protein PHS14_15115 [Elusimicrobia bacterium]|nr:hypothetical protein [Elusimicrobiota bacterium]